MKIMRTMIKMKIKMRMMTITKIIMEMARTETMKKMKFRMTMRKMTNMTRYLIAMTVITGFRTQTN